MSQNLVETRGLHLKGDIENDTFDTLVLTVELACRSR